MMQKWVYLEKRKEDGGSEYPNIKGWEGRRIQQMILKGCSE